MRHGGHEGNMSRKSQHRRSGESDARRQPGRASRAERSGTAGERHALARAGKRRRRRRLRRALVAALVALVLVAGACVALVMRANHRAAQTGDAATSQNGQTDIAASDVVMTLGGSADTYVLKGEDYLEAGCHAVDRTEGDITSTVKTQGKVDTSKAGDYTVTYTARASGGAKARAKRTVHVVDSFESGTAASLPVLMYHYVYTRANPPADLNNNYLLDTQFEEQLRYLSQNGYYYPSYEEVRGFVDGTHSLPAKSVVLTFDDGEAGFLEYGTPLLAKYQVPATSFVICSDDDAADKIVRYANPYVQFQSHSYDMHRDGTNIGKGGIIYALSQDEIVSDLRQAQQVLGTTEAFAYPYGDNDDKAQAAVEQAGILCAFTVHNDRVRPGDNPYALSRVRIASEYTEAGFEYLVEPEAR